VTFRIIDGVAWIGDRAFPYAEVDVTDSPYHTADLEMKIRRMRIPAENGWTISVIWGSMTYSDNHDHPSGGLWGKKVEWHEESKTAEIRIWNREQRDALVNNVEGYLSTEVVLLLIDLMATWASDADPQLDLQEILRG